MAKKIRCSECNEEVSEWRLELLRKSLAKVLEGKYLDEIESMCGLTMDEAKQLREMI